jgi:urease accessory protein
LTRSLLGALLHLGDVGLGPVEAGIAVSVLLVGAVLLAPVWLRGQTTPGLIVGGFAAAGLFHGHVFTEAVAGARATVLAAHLLVLVVAQAALGFGSMAVTRTVAAARPVTGMACRAAGALAVAVGAATLMLAVLA